MKSYNMLHRSYTLLLGILLALGAQPMLAQKLEHRETIRKVLEMEPGTSQLEVWNLNGSVSVTGYNGSEIRIEVEKVIRAENQDQLETGKEEIGFEAISEPEQALVRMTGPCIRWTDSESEGWRMMDTSEKEGCNQQRGYTFVLNFHIQVPQKTGLKVSTVNQGEVLVEGLRTHFLQAGNVNGGITLNDVSGKTKVHSINGDIRITFSENPDKESHFYSLNGDMEIGFQENLSAEIGFETMNGELFTDFKVQGQTTRTRKENPRDSGKGRYKYVSTPVIRIGSGTIMHQFETLNGNVYLKKI